MDLVRAEYIPDDIEDIKQTVLRLKDRVGPDGVIFSSGGIGPTHDDVTYEALAAAFGRLSMTWLSFCSEGAHWHDDVTYEALAAAFGTYSIVCISPCKGALNIMMMS